ncbi:MAG: hypothetical protein L3J91_04990, partial [Thermoplasmata archaeon]|nr:hypothetical protein [Thermoplasmata archaeon]
LLLLCREERSDVLSDAHRWREPGFTFSLSPRRRMLLHDRTPSEAPLRSRGDRSPEGTKTMSELVRPLCSWTGVNPDGDEIVSCDRRATGAVRAANGHRIYTCDEHLASAKARDGSGEVESGLAHLRHRAHESAPEVHVAFG